MLGLQACDIRPEALDSVDSIPNVLKKKRFYFFIICICVSVCAQRPDEDAGATSLLQLALIVGAGNRTQIPGAQRLLLISSHF